MLDLLTLYKLTLDNDNKPSSEYYTFKETEFNKLEVSSNLYLRTDYIDTIRNVIRDSDLLKEKYKYSDLSYLIIQEFIEDHYGKNLDQIIDDLLFSKLGVDLTHKPIRNITLKILHPQKLMNILGFEK